MSCMMAPPVDPLIQCFIQTPALLRETEIAGLNIGMAHGGSGSVESAGIF